MYVAGPAALCCAKAYKLAERIKSAADGGRQRIKPKDAGAVWRLMAATDPGQVRAPFAQHESHPNLGPAIRTGREYLSDLFANGGRGVDLVADDLDETVGDGEVRSSTQSG